MILAIETATPTCSIAIGENEETFIEASTDVPQSHSSVLNSQIREALARSNKTLNDLKAIAVSLGPGSYTGLRIGLSSAKGFCYALDIPLIGIPTLHAMTKQMIELKSAQEALYIPMIDARRDEIYTAAFDENLNEVLPSHAHVITEQSFQELNKHKPIFYFGTGASKAKAHLNTNDFLCIDHFQNSASSILKLALKKYLKNDFESTAYIEPLYLKPFQTITR